ncbi:hypothetical protein LT493_02050 [Streptomyces tricolor]|nr:hypothetical protein [Streptomyces tricolor]
MPPLFTVASTVSAAADGILLLDIARALAGGRRGGAADQWQLTDRRHIQGKARGRAFEAVGITTGAGLALGAMAAGLVTDTRLARLLPGCTRR